MNGLAFKKALYSVPDPDHEIRGEGGGVTVIQTLR